MTVTVAQYDTERYSRLEPSLIVLYVGWLLAVNSKDSQSVTAVCKCQPSKIIINPASSPCGVTGLDLLETSKC